MLSAVRTTYRHAGWATQSKDVIGAGKNCYDQGLLDRVTAALAIAVLLVVVGRPALFPAGTQMGTLPQSTEQGSGERRPAPDAVAGDAGERIVAGYVGIPNYLRSDLKLTRPDGTEMNLKELGWDGDAFHFPIDGGVRTVHWGNRFGFMVDFLHNKAIARLGRGAHGRKLKYPVVEEVEATGFLKGKPAPKRIKLTDIFERLEFTHGHNMLFFTGMMKFADLAPGLRPYAGLGAGFAIPHTEVRFTGDVEANHTNEYQYAGPAAQLLFGLEYRIGKMSYFVEYKFSYAWIQGALTADKSWKNWNMPGDLLRQFLRWWHGVKPGQGNIATTLGAHQIIVGAGYRWNTAVARGVD